MFSSVAILNTAPGRFQIAPEREERLLYTVMPPVPVQVTVPVLVRVFCKFLLALPLMLSVALLATVSEPVAVPPDQFIIAPASTNSGPVKPPPQLNVPTTVLAPLNMLPASV